METRIMIMVTYVIERKSPHYSIFINYIHTLNELFTNLEQKRSLRPLFWHRRYDSKLACIAISRSFSPDTEYHNSNCDVNDHSCCCNSVILHTEKSFVLLPCLMPSLPDLHRTISALSIIFIYLYTNIIKRLCLYIWMSRVISKTAHSISTNFFTKM